MAIFVYNREKEMFDGENNYRIYRPYLLGNPYTHIKNRETKAIYLVNSREEAVQKYSHYLFSLCVKAYVLSNSSEVIFNNMPSWH
jgi:hypothetical protein